MEFIVRLTKWGSYLIKTQKKVDAENTLDLTEDDIKKIIGL